MIDISGFEIHSKTELITSPLQNTHELLLNGEKLIGEATWEDIWFLANKAHLDRAENGIKLRIAKDGVKTRQYIEGNINGTERSKHSIKPPSEPLYGDIKFKTVFIHMHPDSDTSMERMSWLLSGLDNGATLQYLSEGGLSTIADRDGLTTLISAAPITIPTDESNLFEAIWSNSLSVYYDNMDLIERLVKADQQIGTRGSVFTFTVRDHVYGVVRKYLRIGRDFIDNSDITLDELCFGDGLQNIMKKLQIDTISSEKNICMALKKLDETID